MSKLTSPVIIFLVFVVVMLGLGIFSVIDSSATWHLVQIQEGTTQKYSIAACHRFTGCRLYGDRWDFTDEGLTEAEKTFSYYNKVVPPTKVVKVIE